MSSDAMASSFPATSLFYDSLALLLPVPVTNQVKQAPRRRVPAFPQLFQGNAIASKILVISQERDHQGSPTLGNSDSCWALPFTYMGTVPSISE